MGKIIVTLVSVGSQLMGTVASVGVVIAVTWCCRVCGTAEHSVIFAVDWQGPNTELIHGSIGPN